MTLPCDDALKDHVLDLLQRLVRVDTTNPGRPERPAADLVAQELTEAGLEPRILESAPGRANVVTRLRGTGEQPPLLLTGHLDVVPAEPEHWTHPPFEGVIDDGFLWGRGTLDMKNHVAMSAAILCRLAREGYRPRRDLIFAAVADEETGCDHGSLWLADHHPELVRAEFALGEGGGFNLQIAGKRFITIQAAEKGMVWVRATATGSPGHGSMPRRDSAVATLSAAVARLSARGLPARRTAAFHRFLRSLGGGLAPGLRALLPALVHPGAVNALLRHLPVSSVTLGLQAMTANTATPTVLRAGEKTNVIPGSASVEIDGRTLPGTDTASFLADLGEVLGEQIQLEVLKELPPVVTEPLSSPLYHAIEDVLSVHAPGAIPLPHLTPGFTDAKGFTRLGMRYYGFAPVWLPDDLRFADLFHGHDERIPLEGLRWGTQVLWDVVQRMTT